MRSMLKGCCVPELFWWQIPLWDVEEQKQTMSWHPFLLPHEMVHRIVAVRGSSFFDISQENFPDLHERKLDLCTKLRLPPQTTVCLGVHGDGVPYTKKDSLEMLSYNFLSHPTADRIPFTGVSKRFVCKCGCKGRHTWNALLLVFAWSVKMLLAGTVSCYLPDGQAIAEHDRNLVPGFKLCCRAVLMQCRGDWPFLKQLFAFPAWNSDCICWQCKCNKSDTPFTDCSASAAWRQRRYQPFEFLTDLVARGIELCTLLTIPGFTLGCVVLDWLHVVDLGVGADVLGAFFWELITTPDLMPGNNKEQRLRSLWSTLLAWYRVNKPASVLDNLTEEMIKAGAKKPKLRCKGAECRYLIPFAAEHSAKFAQKGPHNKTVAELFKQLFMLQQLVGGSVRFSAEAASTCCRKFCVLYSALAAEATAGGKELWQMKPKVHLLQELIEYQSWEHGCPRHFWCYRDESWCGFWARCSKRRGGANHASTTAERLLSRYRALDPHVV